MEASLLNLGSEGMQVTLKSVSKHIGEKICKIESSVGIASLITRKFFPFHNYYKSLWKYLSTVKVDYSCNIKKKY